MLSHEPAPPATFDRLELEFFPWLDFGVMLPIAGLTLLRRDRNLPLSAQLLDFITTEKQGAICFDHDRIYPSFAGGFDGGGSNYGDIESEILIGLGDFHHHRFAFAQLPASFDRFVCALEGFDSENGSLFHDNCLPDI